MKIILYSNKDCPRCAVLKEKLKAKNIQYIEEQNYDPNELKSRGFSSVPVLQISSTYLDFNNANNWINEM